MLISIIVLKFESTDNFVEFDDVIIFKDNAKLNLAISWYQNSL